MAKIFNSNIKIIFSIMLLTGFSFMGSYHLDNYLNGAPAIERAIQISREICDEIQRNSQLAALIIENIYH